LDGLKHIPLICWRYCRLNELGIEPPRGGPWSHMTVLRMMARLGLKG